MGANLLGSCIAANLRQCLINALTGHVGTGRHLSGYPTYQALEPNRGKFGP